MADIKYDGYVIRNPIDDSDKIYYDVHGPFTFSNVTKPVLLAHACTEGTDDYKTKAFK
jgi:hypothetical protein